MTKKPRYYQNRGAKKICASLMKGHHPVGAFPTGSGKSLVLCMLTDKYLSFNIERDVLVLSHESNILKQDLGALEEYFDEMEIGLYSAGLDSKTIKKITVAGIQSVWKKPELFENVGLVIIDEAHLVNAKDSGMYRKFLKCLSAQYVGLTATPFRLGYGYIYKGDSALFNKLAYDLTSTENYNKLVSRGYLSKMYCIGTKLKLDTNKLPKQGGDFKESAMAVRFNKNSITEIACTEMTMAINKNKLKKILIFAIDIEHADNIAKQMNENGIKTIAIHSKSPQKKDKSIEKFKKNKYKCAVGIQMLTTGLDIPEIDLLGILRPTMSPSLHVQILGRGGRPLFAKGFDITLREERLQAIKEGGKPHCFVMDFAKNIARLGPINDVHVAEKKSRKGGSGEAITKICPKCKTEHFAAVKKCDFCGHKFIFKTKLSVESEEGEVIAKKKRKVISVRNTGTWLNVENIEYKIHSKKGKVSSLKVTYKSGILIFNKFICIDHGPKPRAIANRWIKLHFEENVRKPKNLRELYMCREDLKIPKRIYVSKENSKFFSVNDYEF